jgi:NAD/NADP transhydrogenase alpha subunit
MYSKNVTTFLLHLVKDGVARFDMNDDITKEVLVAKDGEIVNARVRGLLGAQVPS